MKLQKGKFYATLCITSILILLVWYVNRINAIIEFDETTLVKLQTYAEEEKDGMIYFFQVDLESKLWYRKIPCKDLLENRAQLVTKIYFNQDIELGVEKGTIYISPNRERFCYFILSLLGTLGFGIKMMLLDQEDKWEDPLITDEIREKMKSIPKKLATRIVRTGMVRKIVTYKQRNNKER